MASADDEMMTSAEEETMSAVGSVPDVEAEASSSERTKWLQTERSKISANKSFPWKMSFPSMTFYDDWILLQHQLQLKDMAAL